MFLSIIFNCGKAHATALLVCSGPDGVVVSADSRGHSLKGEVEDYDKLQLVGDRVIVAEAGLLLVRDKDALRFDVHQWVERSSRKLGPSPRAATVVHALVEAASRLQPLSSLPSVKRAERPQIILLVAGFDSVRRVVIDLRPFAVHDDPQGEPMVGVGLGSGHLDPAGPLFSLAHKRRPDLAEPATLSQRADLCGLLLTVETELNPLVAAPIRQILLGKPGSAEKRIWASSPPPADR